MTSGYAPLGALIVSDRVAEPFLRAAATRSCTASPSRATPSSCAVALKSIEAFETRADPRARDAAAGLLAATSSRRSATSRSSATSAGRGSSGASSSCGTSRPGRASTTTEAERLLRGFVSPELFRRGLICRSDDRGDPVVQVAPPLICEEAGARLHRRHAPRGARRGRSHRSEVGRPARVAVVGDAPERRPRNETALDGDRDVDVAIVGAGLHGAVDGAHARRPRPAPARRRARAPTSRARARPGATVAGPRRCTRAASTPRLDREGTVTRRCRCARRCGRGPRARRARATRRVSSSTTRAAAP